MNWYLVFFILYILIVVIIGIISSRKESEDGFMIADRKVQGFQVAATMSAGFFDGATLAIYTAYIYMYGLSAIWLFVGLALGFLLVKKYAPIIKKKADKLKVYSMPEYFYKAFGKDNGLMFSFFLILQFFLLLTVNLIVSGKILSMIFPISYNLAVIIGGIVILTYLLLAGFKAVIKTDFFQLMIMFLMTLGVAIILFGDIKAIPVSEFNLTSLGIGNIIGFLIIAGVGLLVAPDLWQRIFATKDRKNLDRGLSYSSIIVILLGLLLSIIGLITKNNFPNIASEDALVIGFSSLLPAGILVALGMVLLYAVALSSSDTATFVVSSIVTRDLKNYSRKNSTESMKKLTRIFMMIFVALAVILGIFYQNVMSLGFSLASLNLALVPVVFGSFYWKLKERAVFWSLILAFLSILILFIFGQLDPQTAVISLPVALISLFVLQKVFKK
jgi:sodium/proline symporter